MPAVLTAVIGLLAPDSPAGAEELERELLIREARRRQRRRRLDMLLIVALAAMGAYLIVRGPGATHRSGSLLARRLHFPTLAAGRQCPVSSGYVVNDPYFGGDALGKGPVRVLVANGGDVLHGRIQLGLTASASWRALQTLWFAMPGYNGPFIVRAARLDKPGPIAVQPAFGGPGSGPLIVPAGPTLNSYPSPTGRSSWAGYRTVPGATWVKAPGCYAWQVDGRGFSEIIVFDAVAARG